MIATQCARLVLVQQWRCLFMRFMRLLCVNSMYNPSELLQYGFVNTLIETFERIVWFGVARCQTPCIIELFSPKIPELRSTCKRE